MNTSKSNIFKKMNKKLALAGAVATTAFSAMPMTALAGTWEEVTISNNSPDAGALMGKIIGILLTITRFVGVALVIYGVYEIVMSFMQNQPEAKTKGIIMALAGVVMIALKSVLSSLGIIG